MARADAVVEGRITGSRAVLLDSGLPVTYFDLEVTSTLKGRVPGQMQIKLPGGWARVCAVIDPWNQIQETQENDNVIFTEHAYFIL